MKGCISINYLDSALDSMEKLPKLKGTNGRELPNGKMWIVADPKLVKRYGKRISAKCGIEFRTAFIEGKRVTVAGL